MKTVSLILGVSLLTLASCGKNDSSARPKASPFQSETSYYKATLTPVNAHLAGDLTGDVTLKVKGGYFTAQVRVNGAPAQIMHVQNIHVGDSCPTLAADVNKDGIIDGVEGAAEYAEVLIPLDSDLANQALESVFPTADFAGNYFYGQTISTEVLMQKIKAKNLNMVGKQIVIFGVPAETTLVESVAANYGLTPHASLPIACGSFVKIDALEEGNSNGRKD